MVNKTYTPEEIKIAVEEKLAMLEYTLNPCQFTLNHQIVKIEKEIQELQEICPHKFENGKCIYCNKGE